MTTKKVLITGGAGFIGSHLTEKCLAEGCDVTVIDNFVSGDPRNIEHLSKNPHFKFVQEDICNLEAIMPHFHQIDYVFHLAALADIVPSIVNPKGYHHSNVNGTFSVLEAARAANVKKFLYTASSSCYGIPDEYPTREDAEIRCEYPYAMTKWQGENNVMYWGKIYKMPVLALRLFNVYGPRARTSGTYGAVFGVFLAQKLAGRPFTIVGDGTQTRDFTFVSDVANAFWVAANSDIKGEIFNVGSGNTYSVNRLVELLGGEKIYIPKRPGEPDCTFANTEKIRRMLQWRPEVSFEKGVQIMLDHIDYWREAPVWDPESIKEATKDWFKYLGEGKVPRDL